MRKQEMLFELTAATRARKHSTTQAKKMTLPLRAQQVVTPPSMSIHNAVGDEDGIILMMMMMVVMMMMPTVVIEPHHNHHLHDGDAL